MSTEPLVERASHARGSAGTPARALRASCAGASRAPPRPRSARRPTRRSSGSSRRLRRCRRWPRRLEQPATRSTGAGRHRRFAGGESAEFLHQSGEHQRASSSIIAQRSRPARPDAVTAPRGADASVRPTAPSHSRPCAPSSVGATNNASRSPAPRAAMRYRASSPPRAEPRGVRRAPVRGRVHAARRRAGRRAAARPGPRAASSAVAATPRRRVRRRPRCRARAARGTDAAKGGSDSRVSQTTRSGCAHARARTCGEPRVVEIRRTRTDDDRVAGRAQTVTAPARLGTRDPPRTPLGIGDPPVERGRHLPRDPWQTETGGAQVRCERGSCGRLLEPECHANARGPQAPQAAAVDDRVRVTHRHDDVCDPGLDDGIGARRRAPPVRARFERHEERPAARAPSRFTQRHDLGVIPADRPVEALPHDPSAAHDHGAHDRVRGGPAAASLRQSEGAAHEAMFGDRREAHALPYGKGPEKSGARGGWADVGTTTRTVPGACRIASASPSLIPTVTVGSGVTPDRARQPGSRAVPPVGTYAPPRRRNAGGSYPPRPRGVKIEVRSCASRVPRVSSGPQPAA